MKIIPIEVLHCDRNQQEKYKESEEKKKLRRPNSIVSYQNADDFILNHQACVFIFSEVHRSERRRN